MAVKIEMADADALGFDAERLARIPAFVERTYVAPGHLPGVQLLIARDSKVAHLSSHGIARAAGRQPLGDDSIFRIASMTKPITSIAFMMLVEEGRVALEQPVETMIPEFAGIGVFDPAGGSAGPLPTRPLETPMLMIDLLRHTSGLTYEFQQATPVDAAYREAGIDLIARDFTLDELVRRLAALPLEFSPGTAWNYSVSTDVLGLVIERISGMSLDRFFQERIFAPLGMVDTGFHVPPEKIHRLPDCWRLDPRRGTILFDEGAASRWADPPALLSGGGGLVSTIADYHRFCLMLLGGGALGGERLIGRKTLELMTRNHLPGGRDLTQMSRSMFSEAVNAGQGFGLGFAVTIDPVKAMLPTSAGEFYWGGIFSTAFFVDPVERIHAILMTQLMPSSSYPLRRQLRTMIYSALR
jgi:CubicO group peptidase (beta-lactamase class C family)